MTRTTMALVGDYNPEVTAHRAIPKALELAASSLGCQVEPVWIGTDEIGANVADTLKAFDGIWCAPASPYRSMDGALRAIRHARENKIPFFGTCGGFQHALIEYARNVLGLARAEHEETSPEASNLVVSRLSCAMVEKAGVVRLEQGSRARQLYGRDEVLEGYRCSFGLNPRMAEAFAKSGMRFTGHDPDGAVRVFELAEHPFLLGTLFQPERSALRGEAHPVVRGFVEAMVARSAKT